MMKSTRLFPLAAAFALALATESSAGRVQWTTASGGNGHFYEAVLAPGGIDWFSAQSQAEALGGYLATITSAGENGFVHSLIASDSRFWINVGDSRGPWLGGFQPAGSQEPAGGWTWVTGEPFSYENWSPGRAPNNGGDENSLHYFGTGPDSFADTWNDLNSNDVNGVPRGFIVESVPEPGATALLALGILLGLAVDRRRVAGGIRRTAVSWLPHGRRLSPSQAPFC